MRLLMICLIALIVAGCGEYGDKIDSQLVAGYKQDCVTKGYSNIKITYMFGRPSAYYTCF